MSDYGAGSHNRNSIQTRERDVFVSHSRSDSQVARRLIEALSGRGLSVWFDAVGSSGASFTDRLERIERAGAVILLLSNSALSSRWVRREMEHAVALSPRRVFIVQLEQASTPLPLHLDTYRRLYLERPSMIEELVDILYPSLAESLEPRTEALQTGFGEVPERIALVGVDGYLDELRKLRTGTTWIVGPGGSGKTKLAIEYAHAFADQYDSLFWLDAPHVLAPNTDKFDNEHDAPPQLRKLRKDIEAARAPLLIIEGLDDPSTPDKLLKWVGEIGHGEPHCRTLITSRRIPAVAGASASPNVLAIGPLTVEQSVEFLRASTGLLDPKDESGLRAVAVQVNRLPLALSLASGLINTSGLGTISELLDHPTRSLVDRLLAQNANEIDRTALERMALLREFADALEQDLSVVAGIDDPSRLVESGLLRESEDRYFLLHVSLADLLKSSASRDSIREAIHVVTEFLPDPETAGAGRVLSAVADFADYRELDWEPETKRSLSEIVVWLAAAWRSEHQPQRALEYADEAAQLAEESGDIGARVRARNLGSALLFDLGRLVEAVEMEELTVALAASELGPDDPLTTASRATLAVSLRAIGRIHESTDLQREVFEKYSQLLGEDHPDTVGSLVNLSVCLRSEGRLEEAADLLESARFSQRDYGSSTQIAARQNLATIYHSLGRYADAEDVLEDLLSTTSFTGRDVHAARLAIRSNLATIAASQGDLERAKSLQESILAELTMRLGTEHPSTLAAAGHLATFHGLSGDVADAIVQLEEVLTGWTTAVGEGHPQALRVRAEIAHWSAQAGDIDGAMRILDDVIPDSAAVFGPDHPETERLKMQLRQLSTSEPNS